MDLFETGERTSVRAQASRSGSLIAGLGLLLLVGLLGAAHLASGPSSTRLDTAAAGRLADSSYVSDPAPNGSRKPYPGQFHTETVRASEGPTLSVTTTYYPYQSIPGYTAVVTGRGASAGPGIAGWVRTAETTIDATPPEISVAGVSFPVRALRVYNPELEPIGYEIESPNLGFVSDATAHDDDTMAKLIASARADGLAMAAPAASPAPPTSSPG